MTAGRSGWFFGLNQRFSSPVKFLPGQHQWCLKECMVKEPPLIAKGERTGSYQQRYRAEESPHNNDRNPSGQMSLTQLENPRLQTGSPDGHKQLRSFRLNYGRRALSAWRVTRAWEVFSLTIPGLLQQWWNTGIKTKLTWKGSTL